VLERRDVIVVASVPVLWIGSPEDYREMHLEIEEGMGTERDEIWASYRDTV